MAGSYGERAGLAHDLARANLRIYPRIDEDREDTHTRRLEAFADRLITFFPASVRPRLQAEREAISGAIWQGDRDADGLVHEACDDLGDRDRYLALAGHGKAGASYPTRAPALREQRNLPTHPESTPDESYP